MVQWQPRLGGLAINYLAAFPLFTIGTSDTWEVEKLLKSHSIRQITTQFVIEIPIQGHIIFFYRQSLGLWTVLSNNYSDKAPKG